MATMATAARTRSKTPTRTNLRMSGETLPRSMGISVLALGPSAVCWYSTDVPSRPALYLLSAYCDSLDYRLTTMTQLHQAIYEKLNDAGIPIAFPQRDVHLDTTKPLEIKVQHEHPP